MINLIWDRRTDGDIATVEIDNARKANSLTHEIRQALIETLSNLSGHERLRAIVLRGAGDRGFSGGADVAELAALTPDTAVAFITEIHQCCAAIRAAPVPVIARIHGYVLGAGLELAAACDVRVASTESHFGMPEVKIGMPSVIEAALLPQLIGWGRTRYLLLSGETVPVAAARDWGMFDFVVAPDELDASVERMCSAILENGAQAVRDQKALISDWERLPIDQAIQRGIEMFAKTWQGDETRRMTGARLAAMSRKSGR